jgi:hypothetical protein
LIFYKQASKTIPRLLPGILFLGWGRMPMLFDAKDCPFCCYSGRIKGDIVQAKPKGYYLFNGTFVLLKGKIVHNGLRLFKKL